MFRCLGLWLLLLLGGVAEAQTQAEFDVWLEALRLDAKQQGISQETIDSALSNVTFTKRVISKDRAQAEFVESYQDYINKRVTAQRVSEGQAYMRTHAEVLNKVAADYGVPAAFIVAIVGVETNYGSYKLSNSLVDVLSTLAFDSRRADYFRKELMAALTILDKQYANVDQLKSSWAGALGTPQFMPSTYLMYAVDANGDGLKDIWNPGPDLFASVANYLSRYGWNKEEAWARKVALPAEKISAFESEDKDYATQAKACERYEKHFASWRSLAQWNDEGVRRMTGASLPAVDINAALLVTNPELARGYLIYNNFCVIMRYNPSFKYALSVGILADEIR